MAKRGLRQTEVTWRGGVLLIIFVFVGAVVGMDFGFGDKSLTSFAEWVVLMGGVLSALLIGFRIRGAADGSERIQILKKVAIGALLMVAAGVATVISHNYLSWVESNARWFIVPTGLYLSGMALIANAMNPQHEQWAAAPRRSRVAVANKGRVVETAGKSRPRKWGRAEKSVARPVPVIDESPVEELQVEEVAVEETVKAKPLPAPRSSLPLARTLPRPPMPKIPAGPVVKRADRNT